MGEGALLLDAGPTVTAGSRALLAAAACIERAAISGVETILPTLSSLLITFDPLHISPDALRITVASLLAQPGVAPPLSARTVEIPVRYGGGDGPDLADVAAHCALTPTEVVTLHAGSVYRVLMIGFAPGYPYIGPLPPALELPRRATPRQQVPAGSVAIAAGLAGIYPDQLPGGWHLIGRTDLRLFDPHTTPPALLAIGDAVRFVPIDGGVLP